MANEFIARKGLIALDDSTVSGSLTINTSGSTVFDIQGSQGQLFSVTDSLTGTLMSVNDISGLPILEVSSDDKVVMGTFGAEGLVVTGSNVNIGKVVGNSHTVTGSLRISGSVIVNGSINATSLTGSISSSNLSDTLPVSKGGTGATTFTNNRVLTGNGTSALVDEANLTFDGSTLTVTGALTTTGNAKIGDATSDTHTVTGSLNVSGSIKLNNSPLNFVNTPGLTASIQTTAGTGYGSGFLLESIDAPIVLKTPYVTQQAPIYLEAPVYTNFGYLTAGGISVASIDPFTSRFSFGGSGDIGYWLQNHQYGKYNFQVSEYTDQVTIGATDSYSWAQDNASLEINLIGSTKIGTSSLHAHQITGSLGITGSSTLNGSLFVTGSGSIVGIGTTSPISTSLHIQVPSGSVNSIFRAYNGSILKTNLREDGVQQWFLRAGNGQEVGMIGFSTPGNFPGITYLDSGSTSRSDYRLISGTGGWVWQAHSGSGFPPELMRLVGGTGFLGIGTNAPSAKLHVVGDGVFYTGGATGSVSVGRSATERLSLFVDDGNNVITAINDVDENTPHYFTLNREFGGTGESHFRIQNNGNTELVILGSSGNVGINKTTANARLDVNGNAIVTGSLTVTGTIIAQEFKAELVSSSIIYESGSTKFGDSIDDVHQRTGSMFISGGIDIKGTSTFSSSLNLNSGVGINFVDQRGVYPTDANSAFVWTLNNDNARIYAQQPSSDAIDFVFKIADNVDSNDRYIYWIDNYLGAASDAYPLWMDGGKFVVNYLNHYNSSAANNVDFYVLASGSTNLNSPLLFADVSANRVGIGTNSPSQKLHITSGSSGATPVNLTGGINIESSNITGINILSPNNGSGRIYFGAPVNDDAGSIEYYHNATQADGYMTLKAGGGGRIFISGNGNVGIGTAGPNTLLDINGNTNITGSLGITSNLNLLGNISLGTGLSTPTITFSGENVGAINTITTLQYNDLTSTNNSVKLPINTGTLALTSDITATTLTGVVPISKGGTGTSSFTNNRLLTGNGTSAIVDEANLTFDGSTLTVTGALTTTGNAKLGDTTSDSHTVTGSLSITGSLSLAGGFNSLLGTQTFEFNNGNLHGVNELKINDPGEGIIFSGNTSGDVSIRVEDDSLDNRFRFIGQANTRGEFFDTLYVTQSRAGIGISTPAKTFTVQINDSDTAVTTGRALGGGAAGAGVKLENASAVTNTYVNLDFRANTADGRIALVNRGTNQAEFQFITDNGGSPAAHVVIGDSGNVRLGSTISNSHTISGSVNISGSVLSRGQISGSSVRAAYSSSDGTGGISGYIPYLDSGYQVYEMEFKNGILVANVGPI